MLTKIMNRIAKTNTASCLILVLGLVLSFTPVFGQTADYNRNIIPSESHESLDLEKLVDSVTAAPGSHLTYTIYVTNYGEDNIEDVIVQDEIPTNTYYIYQSATMGGSLDWLTNIITWNIDVLLPDETVELSFTVAGEPALEDGYEIVNTAEIVSPVNETSNEVVTTIYIPDPLPFRAIKEVDSAYAAPSSILTYTIRAYNDTRQAVEGLYIQDYIPPLTDYVDGSATNGGKFYPSYNLIIWQINYLAPGEYVEVSYQSRIYATAQDGDEIPNRAKIAMPITIHTNEVITIVRIPVEPPELEIVKQVDSLQAYAGDTLTYTISVENTGEVTGENPLVSDTLPLNTILIPGSITGGGTYDAQTGIISWQPGNMNPGESVSYEFKVAVESSTPENTTITNIALAELADLLFADTVGTLIVAKPPPPELEIVKQVDSVQAYAGDTLTYTISVENTGEVTAENPLVSDTLPLNTTLIPGSITGGGTYDSQTGIISWQPGDMDPGESIAYEFKAAVESSTPENTTITNIALAELADLLFADTVGTLIVAKPLPELVLTKQVDSAQAYTRDTLTYTISVENTGETEAEDIEVIDFVPEYIEYIPGSASNGGSWSPYDFTLRWLLSSLESGETTDLTFNGYIKEGTPENTEIENIVLIELPEKDLSDTAVTIVVMRQPKIEVEKTVDSVQAYAGDTLTYSITVRNNGEGVAEDVRIQDYVPPYASYIPGSVTDGGDYDQYDNMLSWTIPLLEAGGSFEAGFKILVDVDTPENTDITNTAYVYYLEDTYDDNATTTIVARPAKPNLEIDKTVDSTQAYAGDTLTYMVTVKNTGKAAAEDVRVEDYIPDNTAYIPGSVTGGGDYDDYLNILVWSFPSIAPDESFDLSFKASIDEDTPESTEISNIAAGSFDDILVADTAKTIVVAQPTKPDLKITKLVDSVLAYAGDTLTYTLEISNDGTAPAREVSVVDIIPDFTEYVVGSATENGTYISATNSLNWSVASLSPDETATLGFKVKIDKAAPEDTEITNIGSLIVSDGLISDTVKTTVVYRPIEYPELVIEKQVDSSQAYAGDTLTYTITITNIDETVAEDIGIQDIIAQYTSYVPGSVTGGGVFDDNAGRLSWLIESLTPEEAVDLSFCAKVGNGTAEGTNIENIASIVYPDSLASDTAYTLIVKQPPPIPELEIAKQVDSARAYAGDTLTYTITVTNIGETIAAELMLNDAIPEYTEYVEGSVDAAGSYDIYSNSLNWPIVSLEPEETAEFSFKAKIIEGTAENTIIENIAGIMLPDESEIADTAYTTVVAGPFPPPDLELEKTVDSVIAYAGSIITYHIILANTGEEDAVTDIMVWDYIPDMSAYVDGSATAGGVYNEQNNQVRWDWIIGSIAPGHTIDLSFQVKIDPEAPKGTRIINQAQAALPGKETGSQITAVAGRLRNDVRMDTVQSNIVVTTVDVKTVIEDEPTIHKEVDRIIAVPGNTLTYTLTVANPGEEEINSITVTDAIPDMTSYVGGSASVGGTYNGATQTVSWTFGPLVGYASEEMSFKVEIDSHTPDETDIVNQAYIIDPVPVTSNQTVTTVVLDRFNISKSVDRIVVTNTDTVTYTIEYLNATGVAVDNVVITDTLESGLVYITGSATGSSVYDAGSRTLTWDIGTVEADEGGSVGFKAAFDGTVENLQQIPNLAYLSSNGIPIDTSNIVLVTLQFPDITLSKTASPVVADTGDIIQYTIIAVNDGAGPLNNGELVDNLPTGFEYIFGTAAVNGTPVTAIGTDPLVIPVGNLETLDTAIVTYSTEIMPLAALSNTHANSAVLRGLTESGLTVQYGPVRAYVALETPQLTVTKTVGAASGTIGSLIPYTIVIENHSDIQIDNITVTDCMPYGFFYIDGTSSIDGASVSDPAGSNPYVWSIGSLASNGSMSLRYVVQLGASAGPGIQENVARAEGTAGFETVSSNESRARVSVYATTLPGAIRGRIIVDCDGDGFADIDSIPSGIDIYLDDGSQSRVNEKGMFYFGTVRAGERAVAIDVRDLDGFYLPDDQPATVFVHVHETGESYVTFRICPDYPRLSIAKYVSIVPRVMVTKTARLNADKTSDTSGIVVDYDITIQSGANVLPAPVRVVDSFPDEARLIIHENQTLTPSESHNKLTYDISAPEQKMTQSVYYSVDDLEPGRDRSLTNKVQLVMEDEKAGPGTRASMSVPIDISIGTLRAVSPEEINIKIAAAYFETSKDYLRREAIPILNALVDSINKYSEADIRVEGHADYRPIHTKRFPSNWELSEARAKTVVDWLVTEGGIDRDRLPYEGFAATRPVDTGHTEAAWQKNRRTEVIIKESLAGGFALGDIDDGYRTSTAALVLSPTAWDTFAVATGPEIVKEWQDIWEVRIVVENHGPGTAENPRLYDELPDGVEYIDGTASLDGDSIAVEIDGTGKMYVTPGAIDEGQTVEIHYQLMRANGSEPHGVTKAAVELTTRNNRVVTQESNTVSFR